MRRNAPARLARRSRRFPNEGTFTIRGPAYWPKGERCTFCDYEAAAFAGYGVRYGRRPCCRKCAEGFVPHLLAGCDAANASRRRVVYATDTQP
jgi:hypothetical protein